jgi:hypothetical protein
VSSVRLPEAPTLLVTRGIGHKLCPINLQEKHRSSREHAHVHAFEIPPVHLGVRMAGDRMPSMGRTAVNRFAVAMATGVMALGCTTRVCTDELRGQCVGFRVVDDSTGSPICNATTAGGAAFGFSACSVDDGGSGKPCSYAVAVDDSSPDFSVSLDGYVTQTIAIPTDECGHLAGSGPTEVRLVRR